MKWNNRSTNNYWEKKICVEIGQQSITHSIYVEIEQLKSFQHFKYCHIYVSFDHIRLIGEMNEKEPVTLPECPLKGFKLKKAALLGVIADICSWQAI